MNEFAVIHTRESLLRLSGFNPVKEFKRSHKAIREAHHADKPEWTDEDGNVHNSGPDHPTRLKAADLNLKLADAYPKPNDLSADPSRPIAVNIILAGSNGHAGVALQSHGVRLHLSDGAGDGA